MKIFKEYQPKQTFLLPPSLDDFVPANHEVHIISAVIDQIDLSSITEKYEGGGCPAYAPEMMMKVLKLTDFVLTLSILKSYRYCNSTLLGLISRLKALSYGTFSPR